MFSKSKVSTIENSHENELKSVFKLMKNYFKMFIGKISNSYSENMIKRYFWKYNQWELMEKSIWSLPKHDDEVNLRNHLFFKLPSQNWWKLQKWGIYTILWIEPSDRGHPPPNSEGQY